MCFKVIMGCLVGIALASCGPLADGQSMDDGASSAQDIKPSAASTSSSNKTVETPIGMLPKKVPKKTALIQARLTNYLKTNAADVIFAAKTTPLSESVMRQSPGFPSMMATINPESALYLVIDNIQSLPSSTASKVTEFKCYDDSLYRGYAAANPSLFTSLAAEAGYSVEAAIPYGLIICDQGDDFEVMALPITHNIFKNDPVKNEVLKTLPKDHPLFN